MLKYGNENIDCAEVKVSDTANNPAVLILWQE